MGYGISQFNEPEVYTPMTMTIPRRLIFLVFTFAFLSSMVNAASIAESSGARLIASDSTDATPAGLSVSVTYFAQFMNASSGSNANGTCIVSHSAASVSNQVMTQNTSGDGRYFFTGQPIPLGDSTFSITCSATGLGPVVASDTATARQTANLTIQNAGNASAPFPVHFNVSFVNSTNGAVITGASCSLRFPEEAGSPLAQSLVFNPSTARYDTRRSFTLGGIINFNATCSVANFETVTAPGTIQIRQFLPNATKFQDPLTTNFSSFDNLDAVSLTLANAFGQIRWINAMNATLRDFDSLVRIGNNYVSINASSLGQEYNSSIEVTLFNAVSSTIVVAQGFFFFPSEVRTVGIPCSIATAPPCQDIRTVGTTVSFRASFPAGFALGADANLSVRNDGPIGKGQTITVFANYSNASNGAPVTNAAPFNGACIVTFPKDAGAPVNGKMGFDGGAYRFSREIPINGTIEYNVTCESDTFTFLQGASSFFVVSIGGVTVTVNTSNTTTPAEVPPGPVDPVPQANVTTTEASPSRALIATSGGVTTEFNKGEEVDVSINGVTIRAGISSIQDGVVQARLGSEKGDLSQGQELLMDVDRDGLPDISMKLLGVSKDSAKVILKKLRGGDDETATPSVATDDENAASSSSAKPKPKPIEEPLGEEDDGLSWWWFVLIFLGLLGIGQWYFRYNQRMKNRFL